jgi:hypothetical protein
VQKRATLKNRVFIRRTRNFFTVEEQAVGRYNKLETFVRSDGLFDESYKTKPKQVNYTYDLINKYIFDGALTKPEIIIKRPRGYWGMCEGLFDDDDELFFTNAIFLSDNFPYKAMMISALAHEMVHQWQWDILSNQRYQKGKLPIMSHGPSFLKWRKPLSEYFIPLRATM